MNVKTISVLGSLKRMVLCHSNHYGRIMYTCIESLSKEDENFIEELIANKRNVYFKNAFGEIIRENQILCYGEINIKKEEDIELIKKLNLIDDNYGNWVPSSFNYKNATIISKDGIVKIYDTFNPILNFKWCHCRLGKPKRVIIYNIIGRKNRNNGE